MFPPLPPPPLPLSVAPLPSADDRWLQLFHLVFQLFSLRLLLKAEVIPESLGSDEGFLLQPHTCLFLRFLSSGSVNVSACLFGRFGSRYPPFCSTITSRKTSTPGESKDGWVDLEERRGLLRCLLTFDLSSWSERLLKFLKLQQTVTESAHIGIFIIYVRKPSKQREDRNKRLPEGFREAASPPPPSD